MIYILIAVFVVASAWGFAALSSLPIHGFLMLALGSGVVVLGSLACVMVAVHMLDVGIAPLRAENHMFLKRYGQALQPSLLDLLVAGIVSAGVVLLYHHLRIPANFSGLSTTPVYAVAVKWVLVVRASKPSLTVSWRARALISTVYLVLMVLALYLLAQAESARLQTWTYVWLLVTTSAVAAACYLFAANFRASILHGQILRSPTVDLLRSRIGLRATSAPLAEKQDSRRWRSAAPKNPNRFPGGHTGGGKKKNRKR